MFGDIGWSELMLIGIVALIVIGPEDLPQMFRQLGRFTAKMRAMSRDFSRAMDQAAKESGVKDVADSVKGAASATSVGLSKVTAAADRFEKWDPIKSATAPNMAKPLVPAPMPATVVSPVVAEPTIHGSEAQALLKKQSVKKAALVKHAEKPVVIEQTSTPVPKPKVARATKASVAAISVVDAGVPKPRAARKPKKAAEA